MYVPCLSLLLCLCLILDWHQIIFIILYFIQSSLLIEFFIFVAVSMLSFKVYLFVFVSATSTVDYHDTVAKRKSAVCICTVIIAIVCM